MDGYEQFKDALCSLTHLKMLFLLLLCAICFYLTHSLIFQTLFWHNYYPNFQPLDYFLNQKHTYLIETGRWKHPWAHAILWVHSYSGTICFPAGIPHSIVCAYEPWAICIYYLLLRIWMATSESMYQVQYSRGHYYFMCPKEQTIQSSVHNYNRYRPCLTGQATIIT